MNSDRALFLSAEAASRSISLMPHLSMRGIKILPYVQKGQMLGWTACYWSPSTGAAYITNIDVELQQPAG